MNKLVLLTTLLILGCSSTTVADTDSESIRTEFKKFFNTDMPDVNDTGAIYIAPKDMEVLPVQKQPAHISVRITIPGLKKLLVLHGKNKYPDNVCKSEFKQTFVAAYTFDPELNTSNSLTTMRVECSSKVIVWIQTKDGKFYKTEKTINVFNYDSGQQL